ncbi:MAG: GNAT family N-acetyltransferase [Chloroflexota bacterium]
MNSEEIRLPGDLLVRPVTMADLETAVDLFNLCALDEIGVASVPLDGIRSEWTLPGFELDTATRAVFTPEGHIVGYIEVWDIDDLPSRIRVWGRVHPQYQGRGIGTYLMNWAENRARQAIARVPDDVRVSYESGCNATHEPAQALLRSMGMTLVRHFWQMKIELAEPPEVGPLPDGIIIRSMIPQHEERAVIQAVRDSFKDHWGYVEQPFEKEYEHWLHFMNNDSDYDPTLWFVALDGEEIAGISLCDFKSHEDPKMGWIGTLGVRRPWRRRGLGVALLKHSFQELYARGQQKVALGVDAASLTGATRLYERAGMHVARQYDTYEKELRPGREVSTQII